MNITYNQNHLRLWKTYGLNIPYAGLAKVGRDWKSPKASSPFSRLYYIVKGQGTIQLDNHATILEEGKVYLLPAGLPYGYLCDDYMEQLFFHINFTHLNGIDLFRGCDRIYSRDLTAREMESVKQLYLSGNIADAFCLKGILLQELSGFLHMAKIGESHIRQYSPLIEQVFRLAQNPVDAGRHVSDLADQLHVSASTLTKHFRQETGMSPGEYLTQLVITKACNLLLTDDYPIAEIAKELGFTDQFYFAKYFKKQMLISPSGYRRRMKCGQI